ncbi:ribosome biogenesis GTPase YqeH [Hazenella sp. IB182357]|uniref:Ribosome biogenesis GTPase YqeH n=1 Tax=Polycladospora coralii TaxID=2771432 RepID=A0A926RTI5_9BACL|nr:ribosome biogenesis GTPase YqeH [Polycladospora coralii]MBD1372870.1 ribosome biogenesis GTPase YqeH [Polycladospora coralii]
MSSEEKQFHCEGCGVKLQSESPDHLGYAPPSAFEREYILCKRCYRIRHYGEIASISQNPDEYLKKLGEIANTDSLVVQVIDLFDFSGSWIPGIHRHIGKNPLLILANKTDLFPKLTKWGRVREWIYALAKDLGMKPLDVVLTSAVKGTKMEEAIAAIEHHRRGKDVYIVGTTNAGKSTFINRLIRDLEGSFEDVITTSPYPGTTLDMIRIPLDDGKSLIDTPGIVRSDRLSEWMTPEELKVVVPADTVKPRGYQLQDQQTIFLGGMIRIDYVKGERQSFVCYTSNPLYIHRTKSENADRIAGEQRGKLLVPPADPSRLPAWVKHDIHLNGQEKQDIVISGLGWISTGSEKATIRVWAPKGVQVTTRKAII